MASENMAVLVGNLGKPAETKFTPNGVARVTFSLATTRRVKRGENWEDETTWHNVVAWRKENLANYLTKGKQVYVKGYISNRSYEDKEGVKRYVSEIVADEIILLGGAGGNGQKHEDAGGGGFNPAGDDDAVPDWAK